jgi:hypothetical protein
MDVQIELTFMEAISLVVLLIGAAWALLKMNAVQFNKGLDARFHTQDEKLKHIDLLMMDMKRIELDTARREVEYIGKFCTKDELRELGGRSERVSNEIFSLLRRIEDKLDNKVSKDECSTCRGGQ